MYQPPTGEPFRTGETLSKRLPVGQCRRYRDRRGPKVAWGRGPQVSATHPERMSTWIGERGSGGERPWYRIAGHKLMTGGEKDTSAVHDEQRDTKMEVQMRRKNATGCGHLKTSGPSGEGGGK